MATHSSVLAWRITGAGEPGGLTSMGSHRVDTTEVTQQQQQQHEEWLFGIRVYLFKKQVIVNTFASQSQLAHRKEEVLDLDNLVG